MVDLLQKIWIMALPYVAILSLVLSYHLSVVFHYERLLDRANQDETIKLAELCGARDWKFNDVYKPLREKVLDCRAEDIIAPTTKPKRRRRRGP